MMKGSFFMKVFKVFLPLFMILTLTASFMQPVFAASENISEKVLRLHILANSDSTADQDLKLKVRDYFLEGTKDLFTGSTVDENVKIAQQNVDQIKKICTDCVKQNGYNYNVSVKVDKEFFNTRVYDDFTLPAGVYNSIIITLGSGSGHNWWCIVFPSVCLSSCSKSMDDCLNDDEMKLIKDGYTPKFKIIEIYEKIKYKISER